MNSPLNFYQICYESKCKDEIIFIALSYSLLKTEQREGLIKCKDYENYMFYPSNIVTKVTCIAEKIVEPTLQSRDWLCKKYYFDYVTMKVLRTYVSISFDDLKSLHEHAFEQIKSVIATYIVIRLKHFAKEENDCIKKTRSRAKLSKLIIFHGQ